MTRDDIAKRFITELARIAGSVFETSASTRPASAPPQGGFVTSIKAREGEHGTLHVHFGRRGSEALVRKMSPGAEVTDAAIVEALQDLAAQTAAVLDRRAIGADLIVASVEACHTDEAAPDSWQAVEIVLSGQEEPILVALSGDLEFIDTPDGRRAAHSRTLDVIMDIDLPLVVRFGRTELPLKALTALGPGSVIDLGRSPDEPVDILISNQVVARGEVVIVQGNYGVRVRDVISPSERARPMETELS
jgi:flagellar motor switch protein FliN/FliY